MKPLRSVDYFACLFVCLFVLFLVLKLQDTNPQLHYFSPVPKRFTISFICFHFNIILHFILIFTLVYYHSFYYGFILTDYHSFYYGFILTDFMAVASGQNVFVAPQLCFIQRSSLAGALNFAENRPQGAWRRYALYDVSVFNFM